MMHGQTKIKFRSYSIITYRQYSTLTTRPFVAYGRCVVHFSFCLILYQSNQGLIQSQLFLRHINHIQTHTVNIRHYMCRYVVVKVLNSFLDYFKILPHQHFTVGRKHCPHQVQKF